jgi:hypothetical protein
MVPPLAGFRIYAILGVFTIFSLCLLDAFFLNCSLFFFYLFITLGTMVSASTTLFEKKFPY